MTIGVKFPFVIQGGSVAVTEDPIEMLGSRVAFCLGTMIGERVMRPTWGVDIINTVHSVGGELDQAMSEAVTNAFQRWFPKYQAQRILITRSQSNPAYVMMEVQYSAFDGSVEDTIKVETQLPGGTEIYTDEGF